jgi:hypothetical protein
VKVTVILEGELRRIERDRGDSYEYAVELDGDDLVDLIDEKLARIPKQVDRGWKGHPREVTDREGYGRVRITVEQLEETV